MSPAPPSQGSPPASWGPPPPTRGVISKTGPSTSKPEAPTSKPGTPHLQARGPHLQAGDPHLQARAPQARVPSPIWRPLPPRQGPPSRGPISKLEALISKPGAPQAGVQFPFWGASSPGRAPPKPRSHLQAGGPHLQAGPPPSRGPISNLKALISRPGPPQAGVPFPFWGASSPGRAPPSRGPISILGGLISRPGPPKPGSHLQSEGPHLQAGGPPPQPHSCAPPHPPPSRVRCTHQHSLQQLAETPPGALPAPQHWASALLTPQGSSERHTGYRGAQHFSVQRVPILAPSAPRTSPRPKFRLPVWSKLVPWFRICPPAPVVRTHARGQVP